MPNSTVVLNSLNMRISVDTDLCQGHGRCYILAPDLFDTDDYGYCQPTVERDVAAGLEDQARKAASNCPEDAILLIGD